MIQVPTTNAAGPQLIVVGASGLAVWLQAGATVILAMLTSFYVWFTGRLVTNVADQVQAALRIHREGQEQRERTAVHAVELELRTITHTCQVVNRQVHPADMPTHSWDLLGPELLPTLEAGLVARMIELYRWVRRCNGVYHQMVNAPHRGDSAHHENRWGNLRQTVEPMAREVLDAFVAARGTAQPPAHSC